MVRVPELYRTRWIYAVAATCLGLIFTTLFAIVLSGPVNDVGTLVDNLKTSYLALVAFPAALICWPRRSPRGTGRMVLAGFLTVLSSFIIIGLVMGVAGLFTAESSVWVGLSSAAMMVFFVVFFGSIVSLGVPYLIGMCVSVMFADPKS